MGSAASKPVMVGGNCYKVPVKSTVAVRRAMNCPSASGKAPTFLHMLKDPSSAAELVRQLEGGESLEQRQGGGKMGAGEG